MKIRKMILMLGLVFPLAALPSQSVRAASSSMLSALPTESYGGTVSPQAQTMVWRYKTENGKLYKRLYNSSIGVWIGEWIYVRDC